MLSMVLGLLAATPMTIASPGFQSVNVDAKVASFALEHLSERLGALGLRVITPAEVETLIGIERQKQLLGCGDTSCAAELTDALGAEALMIGTLARLGDTLELSIKVISNGTGERKASFSERVKNEGELFKVMDDAALSLSQQLRPVAPPSGLHLRNRMVWPIVIGGAFAIASGVTYGLSFAAHDALTNKSLPFVGDGSSRAASGQTFQTLSAVFGGATLVSAAIAIWFYVSGEPPPLAVSVGFAQGAPSFTVGGRFP